ncbi:monosaccharide ABC transporter substrate-binding protein, CUT2 family [Neorhodopirellula lusitana]|uniref:Monosaccharide ABC transporter substrate-binding protein, CUT2 family n=1 Tax=Neorhodopirellula lusitana TaxID=445327 RepID=A0ABY1QD28_9BACT|nr:substrate-binding domain-containing protein [Neorhodopirellula lusitana]SMP65520.1 monosaccharide ABC transporter substrate-binding protein, CUT2 family [Neorhodopirellula lusitana]
MNCFASFTKTAILILLIAISGCQPPKDSTQPKNKSAQQEGDGQLHFAVIPKGETAIFWQSVKHGADRAGEEVGARITFKGPAKESDRNEQINVVQGFLNAQVDGICLAPLDADALIRPVEEAGRAGVPVVIFDSGLNADKEATVAYVATDNFRGGQIAAEAMAKSLGDSGGKVICLRYNKGSDSTHQREEGFLDGLKQFDNIQVISSDQYSGTTTESAIDKAQTLLNRYGDDVDGIFAACEPNAEGVLRAIRDRGLQGKVKLVAFDSSDSLRNALADGEVAAIVLQDPVQIGYLAVKTLADHLKGKPVETFIDTGVYVATQDNMDDETISRLLNPPKS